MDSKKMKLSYEDKRLVLIIIIILLISFFVSIFLAPGGEHEKNLLIVGGLGVTIISWFVNGYINNENEKKKNNFNIKQSVFQSKQDLKTKFLLDAYFRLENSDHRDLEPEGTQPLIYEFIYLKYAESALTSIQLLGNKATVELANKHILSHGKSYFSDLLIALRDELRDELNLEKLPEEEYYKPTSFRKYRKTGAKNILTSDQQYELIIKLNELTTNLLK